MKTYYFKGCSITKLNNYLQKCYQAKYLIKINYDIIGYSETLKQAKNTINQFIKEL